MRIRLLLFLSLITSVAFAQTITPVTFEEGTGPFGGDVSDIEIHAGTTYYTISAGTIYSSTDAGANWTEVTNIPGSTNTQILDILVDASDNIYVMGGNRLWKSADGVSWSVIIPVSGYNNPTGKLLKNETTGSLYAKAYNNSLTVHDLMRSTDDGLNWSFVYSDNSGDQVNDYTINNLASPASVFVADNSGDNITRSIDDGASFAPSNATLPSAGPSSVHASQFTGNIYAILNSNPGAFVSTNNGVSWSVIAGSTIPWPNNVLLSSSKTSNEFYIFNNNKLHKSTGIGGVGTWTEVTGIASNGTPRAFLANGSTYFVGHENQGIQKTINGGTTWTFSDNGITNIERAKIFISSDNTIFALTQSGVIRRSLDLGDSWVTRKVCDCSIASLVQLTNGNFVGIGDRTVVSTDNGVTFGTDMGMNPDPLNYVVYVDDNNLYALGGSQNSTVYFSNDQGDNWASMGITGLPSTTNFYKLSVLTNGDVVMIGHDNNINELRIFHIPDGTTTALERTVAEFTNFRSADASGTKIFAIGEIGGNPPSKIATSVDGGINWTFQDAVELHDLIALNEDIIFGRGNASFMYTNDGGATWRDTEVPENLNNTYRYLESVALTPTGQAFLSVTRHAFYKSSGTVVLPSLAQNFTAIGTGSKAVSFSWEYSGGPTYYVLQRREVGNITYEAVSDTLSSSQRYTTDYSAVPEKDYQYRIQTINASGSRETLPIAVSTPAVCALDIPDNRSWTGVVGVTNNPNVIIRKVSNEMYSISDLTGGYRDAFITNTKNGTFYQNCTGPFIYPDRDLQPNGNGSWDPNTNTLVLNWQFDLSENSSATTPPQQITLTLNDDTPAPTAPALTAYVLSDNVIKLEWTAGNFNETFTLERADNAGFTSPTVFSDLTQSTSTLLDNGPFTPGATYHFRIKAKNEDAEESVYSSTVTVVYNTPKFLLSNTTISNTNENAATFAWGDIDDDGDDDLFVNGFNFGISQLPLTHIFENNGAGDFIQHTDRVMRANALSSSLGDINNDGQLDVVFTTIFGDGNKYVFENEGGLTFTNATSADITDGDWEGIAPTAWIDVDNDGDQDLFAVGAGVQFFLNNGSGTLTLAPSTGNDLLETTADASEFAWADYDNDHDIDVLIIDDEDPEPLRLYKNNGSGDFTLAPIASFAANIGNYTGASWGDFNGDQRLDLFVGRDEAGGRLFRNDGGDVFTMLTDGIAGTPTETTAIGTFGSAWGDLDNDGDLDLATMKVGGLNAVYFNGGLGTSWTKLGDEMLVRIAAFNTSVALSDYDKNGLLDIMAGRFSTPTGGEGGPPPSPLSMTLYKNNTGATGNWLSVKLRGTTTNRQAIGAKVLVNAGTKALIREVSSHSGFASQSSQILHFGLGSETSITSLVVKWPSGISQVVPVSAVNQMITIVEDGAGPVLVSATPAVSSTNISTETNLSITLDEAVTAIASKNIKIYLTADLVNAIHTFDVTAGSVTGNTFAFTVPGKLITSTSYTVKVDQGAFVDQFNNESEEIVWTFTTSAAPLVTTLSPLNNATDVNSNTTLAITFNKAVTGVAGKFVKLFKSTDLVTPVQTFGAHTGTISGNTVTFTPSLKLDPSTLYQLSIDAGAFIDAGSNDFAGLLVANWKFTTDAGPFVSSLLPAHNSTGINANTTVAITFGETVTAVAGKMISIFRASDLVNPVGTLDAQEGVITGNTVTYTLPASLQRLASYKISVEAGAFIDANLNDFGGITTTDWAFTTDGGPTASLAPLNNAVGINSNTTLAITFNRAVTGISGKTIRLFKAAEVIETFDAADGTISGNTVTFTPSTKLERLTVYNVGIDLAAFKDANDNLYAGLAATNWKFTTDAGPTVSSFTPLHNATGVNANTTLAITFGEPVLAATGKSIKLFKGATEIENVSSSNAVITGNIATLTLASKLDRSTNYHVTIDAGAFTDVNLNDYVGLTGTNWSFTTDSGPIVSSLSPVDNATLVNANTTLSVTFNEDILAVTGKKLNVFKGAILVESVLMEDADIVNATASFTLANKLERATEYTITIEAGAITDLNLNDFVGLSGTAWTFTTDAGPTISSLLPANNATAINANSTFTITFNEDILPVSGKALSLFKGLALVETVLMENANVTGNSATFTLVSPLERVTEYTLSLEAGAVTDLDLNDFAGLAQSSWKVTTGGGPTISTLAPAQNESGINANTTLSITFNEDVIAVPAKMLTIMDGPTVVESVLVSDAVISGSTATFTLVNSLKRFKTYSVLVEAGSFTDTNLNAFVGITGTTWSFTTEAGPTLTSVDPTHTSTGINSTVVLKLSFNRDVAVNSGKKMFLFKSTNLVAPDKTINSEDGVVAGSQVSYNVSGLAPSTIYHVTVEEGAVRDLNMNEYAGLTSPNWTFTTASGPEITTFTPTNNATGVNANASVSVTFDKTVTPIPGKKLFVFASTDLVNPVASVNVEAATQTTNTFTFAITSGILLPATIYKIQIEAGAFIDTNNNLHAGVLPAAWSFTTDGGPTISAFAPANNALGINANTNLTITLNRASTKVAGKKISVYESTDLVNPIMQIDAEDGVVSGNTITFDLSSPLNRSTVYHVGIETGAFRDVNTNGYAGLNPSAWKFTTDGGPAIVTQLPAHNATEIAVNSAIEITFNKNVIAVPGKKIKIMNGAATIANVDVSTGGTINGDKFTLPSTGNLPFSTLFSVTVDPGAFTDENENQFVGINGNAWTFTTTDITDITAPVVAFDQSQVPATLDKGFSPINVSVTATDNKAVVSATLFHRKSTEKNFSATPMTFTNNKWESQISNTFIDDMGLQFYFEAEDAAGNKGRQPLAANSYFNSRTAFTSNPPSFQLPSGGTKNSWRIISIPHVLGNKQITSVFNALGAAEKDKWRLIRYTNTPQEKWNEYPVNFTTIERGLGYFINTKTSETISLANASAPSETRDNLFTMPLVAGWNQIGNPYTVAINWTDVINYNDGLLVGTLKGYSSGVYSVVNGDLPVFEGGFVFMEQAGTIEIPFKGQTTSGGRKGFNDLGTDLNEDDWAIRFNLTQAEKTYVLGSVGMSTEAKESLDQFDDITPPRFFDYLEMNFPHPEHAAKRFTRDVVPTEASHTWSFRVDSNVEGEAMISWDNLILASASKDIYLLDVERQTLINMKEIGNYTFDPKESATFKIHFGDDIRVAPERVHLGKAYPNPTNGKTFVTFSLPENGGLQQNVSLDIIDGMGRTIGVLAKGVYGPGYHEVNFDAQNIGNGFYTYRLTVEGTMGSCTEVNKLIIK